MLVNNAGVNRVGPSEHYAEADWCDLVDINLTGVFRCCQVVGARMLQGPGGAIVNLASVQARTGSAGRAAYCATKTGVLGLTRALAVEWAGRGVRVERRRTGLHRDAPHARRDRERADLGDGAARSDPDGPAGRGRARGARRGLPRVAGVGVRDGDDAGGRRRLRGVRRSRPREPHPDGTTAADARGPPPAERHRRPRPRALRRGAPLHAHPRRPGRDGREGGASGRRLRAPLGRPRGRRERAVLVAEPQQGEHRARPAGAGPARAVRRAARRRRRLRPQPEPCAPPTGSG